MKAAQSYWDSIRSSSDATYDDELVIDGSSIEPMVTWGINPGQALGVSKTIPAADDSNDPATAQEAFDFMGLKAGQQLTDIPIDVAFIGSCTNGRISDLREAAEIFKGKKVHSNVTAMVVPGSQQVAQQAEAEGLHHIFQSAGVDWRHAGCSMCLAMNPDRLDGRQMCASSSNRNFIGRQGSPTGQNIIDVSSNGCNGCNSWARSRCQRGIVMTNELSILNLSGTAVPILGNDVDTDRIVPARYLKEVTFDNMGEYLFYDARHDGNDLNTDHPLNQAQYAGASIMVVENNFGCGSSREHAPQAIKRAGFNAIIGESFAEIFSGNCKALGIVTATLPRDQLSKLIDNLQHAPSTELSLSIDDEQLQFGDSFRAHVTIKSSHKKAFIDGTWDELALLKLNREKINKVAADLPYFNW